MTKIYLSGPNTFEHDSNWYQELHDLLPRRYSFVVPMRYHHKIMEMGRDLVADRFIMRRDTLDVQRCRAVLINLTQTPGKPPTECMVELGMAFAYDKDVIVVTDPNDDTLESITAAARAITYSATTLEEAAFLLKGVV
mgnify:CR=1 FL=1